MNLFGRGGRMGITRQFAILSELNADTERMHRDGPTIESSGDSDVDFINLMLPHHRAAIDMARFQLMYGKDPVLRRLAQEIITDQQSDIEAMQLWLKQIIAAECHGKRLI